MDFSRLPSPTQLARHSCDIAFLLLFFTFDIKGCWLLQAEGAAYLQAESVTVMEMFLIKLLQGVE